MLKLEMRTSPRLVQQIGAIERFAGVWERLAQSDVVASDAALESSISKGAEACIQLDSTSPAGLSLFIEVERVGNGPVQHAASEPQTADPTEVYQPLKAAVDAHLAPAEFDAAGLNEIYSATFLPLKLCCMKDFSFGEVRRFSRRLCSVPGATK